MKVISAVFIAWISVSVVFAVAGTFVKPPPDWWIVASFSAAASMWLCIKFHRHCEAVRERKAKAEYDKWCREERLVDSGDWRECE